MGLFWGAVGRGGVWDAVGVLGVWGREGGGLEICGGFLGFGRVVELLFFFFVWFCF